MKDATYFAEIACREMTPDEVCKFRPLIYNLFLQAQVEAFMHAGSLAAEGLYQQARAICPGMQVKLSIPAMDPAVLEQAIKSDQGFFDPDPPSKAA